MKTLKTLLTCAALVGASMAHAQPTYDQMVSDFSGPYIGVKAGFNFSRASGATEKPSHTTFFPGVVVGYGFNAGPVLLGAEAFMDFHDGSATKKDGGIDAKIGYPVGQFMPYARLGVKVGWPASAFHYGLGVEYQFTKNVSMFTEWTHDSANAYDTRWTNNSVTVGANYRFK
ncbi:porin family protein [Paraburkholderia sp. LEh10]|uniref:outer membrane protein n=1 Tax=Paraburkholderia sp. LEh10 TaxID=2821353 RepID=UPI001AE4DB7F|nr:outer membrane beta-barrel protein [Paraburkholderia sp. LEh10]MBP0591868.1 porin family protein [Paraburkholderia sp. LEh10]